MLAPAPTRLSTHAIWCHVLSKATRVEKRSTVVDPRMYSFTVPSVGDRVPSETTMAGDFGVHRSTVREAVRVLEQNGLVRRHDGGKLLYVTAPREGRKETCTAEIWEEMLGNTAREIDNINAQKIGRALRKIGWNPTRNIVSTHAVNKKYGRCRVYLRD